MVMAPDLPGGGTAVSILHSTVVPGARQVVSTSTSPTTSHRHQRHSAENDGVFAELNIDVSGGDQYALLQEHRILFFM